MMVTNKDNSLRTPSPPLPTAIVRLRRLTAASAGLSSPSPPSQLLPNPHTSPLITPRPLSDLPLPSLINYTSLFSHPSFDDTVKSVVKFNSIRIALIPLLSSALALISTCRSLVSSQTSLSAPALVDSYRLHRSKLSILPIKHPSSLSACANLDLSSLSISRCDQVAHRFTSLHFKDHQHVKTYSSKISPRSQPVDLVDFIQTHLSTSSKSQLVNFIQTQLVNFIQTHSSTLPETPRKSQLVDLVDSTRKISLVDHLKNLNSHSPFQAPLRFSACAHLDLSSSPLKVLPAANLFSR